MADKKIVVAGATGLVGNAALRHFGGAGGCEIVALSRRMPRELHGARHVPIDLTDPAQCTRAATELQGATHLVYAALYEAPSLVDGWRDPHQIRHQRRMLRNLMAALEPVAPRSGMSRCCRAPRPMASTFARSPCLRGKAARKCTSSRTSTGRRRIFCVRLQQGKAWHWSILASGLDRRPSDRRRDGSDPAARRLCGDAARAGQPAGLSRRRARVSQAVDVDLLARAIAWSGEADAARNEAFNVTNGDVFTWENVWPAIADALGMKPGKPAPLSLAQEYPKWIAPWDELRRKHDLVSPDLEAFVGLSFQYADYSMRYGQTRPGPPSIVSTVKINQAGFTEMMDTEAMFRKWFSQARASRLA